MRCMYKLYTGPDTWMARALSADRPDLIIHSSRSCHPLKRQLHARTVHSLTRPCVLLLLLRCSATMAVLSLINSLGGLFAQLHSGSAVAILVVVSLLFIYRWFCSNESETAQGVSLRL